MTTYSETMLCTFFNLSLYLIFYGGLDSIFIGLTKNVADCIHYGKAFRSH